MMHDVVLLDILEGVEYRQHHRYHTLFKRGMVEVAQHILDETVDGLAIYKFRYDEYRTTPRDRQQPIISTRCG